MKKQILNLGVVLEKNMQKFITGGGSGGEEDSDPEEKDCTAEESKNNTEGCI